MAPKIAARADHGGGPAPLPDRTPGRATKYPADEVLYELAELMDSFGLDLPAKQVRGLFMRAVSAALRLYEMGSETAKDKHGLNRVLGEALDSWARDESVANRERRKIDRMASARRSPLRLQIAEMLIARKTNGQIAKALRGKKGGSARTIDRVRAELKRDGRLQ